MSLIFSFTYGWINLFENSEEPAGQRYLVKTSISIFLWLRVLHQVQICTSKAIWQFNLSVNAIFHLCWSFSNWISDLQKRYWLTDWLDDFTNWLKIEETYIINLKAITKWRNFCYCKVERFHYKGLLLRGVFRTLSKINDWQFL